MLRTLGSPVCRSKTGQITGLLLAEWLGATCPDVWHVASSSAKWGSWEHRTPSRKLVKLPNFKDKIRVKNHTNRLMFHCTFCSSNVTGNACRKYIVFPPTFITTLHKYFTKAQFLQFLPEMSTCWWHCCFTFTFSMIITGAFHILHHRPKSSVWIRIGWMLGSEYPTVLTVPLPWPWLSDKELACDKASKYWKVSCGYSPDCQCAFDLLGVYPLWSCLLLFTVKASELLWAVTLWVWCARGQNDHYHYVSHYRKPFITF